MRYTICFDEHKECFLAEKVKTSKNPMLFKTKRIAKKYASKLNKQAFILREAAELIDLPDTNPFNGSVLMDSEVNMGEDYEWLP